jgi:hypothetical protein
VPVTCRVWSLALPSGSLQMRVIILVSLVGIVHCNTQPRHSIAHENPYLQCPITSRRPLPSCACLCMLHLRAYAARVDAAGRHRGTAAIDGRYLFSLPLTRPTNLQIIYDLLWPNPSLPQSLTPLFPSCEIIDNWAVVGSRLQCYFE